MAKETQFRKTSGRSYRLVKIAKDLNTGTSTIVDHLKRKGFQVDNKPTTKVTQEMYEELKREFRDAIIQKELAQDIINKKEVIAVKLSNIKRLNWEILPPGKLDWNNIEKKIQPFINSRNQVTSKRNEVNQNLKFILSLKPGSTFIGKKGFKGYVAFKFPNQGLFIMESLIWGNATYVFEKELNEYSKLIKREVLDRKLYLKRIFHKWNRKYILFAILHKSYER